MDDLEELRRLLLRHEREQIERLHERVDNEEKRTRDVASVLPNALKLSRGDELTRALRPTVEASVKESIEKARGSFVDALHPIIGELIRRAVSERLRGLLQSLNQTLENTFSWNGLKWRFEAMRTRKSFAEVVLLRSLLYRVEQIFVIHREKSLVLLHVAADPKQTEDSHMMAGMLSAIQDYAHDSFQGASLGEFTMGDLVFWIRPGRLAYLAAAIRGTPPPEFAQVLDEALDNVHVLRREALEKFNGDASVFEPLRPEFEACLEPQYKAAAAEEMKLTRAWLALAGAAALAIGGGVFVYGRLQVWHGFLDRLQREPGLAITHAEKGWLFPSHVAGLRDPLAADPGPLAQESGLDPAKIDFAWKEYLALDPISIQRRFTQRFGATPAGWVAVEKGVVHLGGAVPYEWIARVREQAAQVPGVTAVEEQGLSITYDPALVLQRFEAAFPLPETAKARVENGTLVLSGLADYECIAPVRTGATRLPGVTAISEKELQVTYDPALVLDRFKERFPLPEDVTASVKDGTLTLAGEASHAWLVRLRAGATEVPGITTLDDKKVTDLDERAFHQSKSVIESAFVYFLPNKDDFATEGFAALSRLPDEIRRCETAARRIGLELTIEVRGQADATGLSEKNADLSRRRAEAVNAFLVQCGLRAEMFRPLAMGAPSAAPATADAPPVGEQSQRRVAFRVLSQAAAAGP